MAISPGQSVPSIPVKRIDADGIADAGSDAVLGTGLVVFFTVPGAFTPTCHVNHLPGFIANAEKLKARGVDRIVCGSVNDAHVMKAWAEQTGATGIVDFIADPAAELAKAMGLARDFPGLGGTRFSRAALILRDGVVDSIFVEDAPGVSGSGAPAILLALEAAGSREYVA